VTFLYGFFDFIRFLCYLFSILIIARAILSWFTPRSTNVLVVYLTRVTEPLLMPIRRILPRTGMIDFSPVIVVVVLQLIGRFLP
jgi:YggT family protein